MSFAYLALYTGDYLRDTRHLSPLRHGVYLLLLMHCWDQRGPLPLARDECAGIANCRSQDELEALDYVLKRFFTALEDGWYNKRIQTEIERAHAIGIKRKFAGAKGYQAKAKHLLSKSRASVSNTTTTTTPSPAPVKAKSKTTSVAALPADIEPEAWQGFVDMRKAIKHPLTSYACHLAFRELAKLKTAGQDPNAVLNQSTFHGWRGLFAIKPSYASARSSGPGWWTSEAATKAKGAELRLFARGGESWDKFRARIWEALNATQTA